MKGIRRLVVAALALLATASSARGQMSAGPVDPTDTLQRVDEALRGLRLEEAEAALQSLFDAHGEAAPFAFRRAMLRFYQGEYEQAVRWMDNAVASAPQGYDVSSWRDMREMHATTLQVTRGYEEVRSADGRYVVLHPPGPERYLVPYAMHVLRQSDDALANMLGARLPGPIRLEIYPSASTLAEVSTLTVEQIEQTGTVALSKWNRLMVTSPRALVRGYPWMDTIAHELVHMALTYLTYDRAPVWLQEGIAKLLERRWRGRDGQLRLHPASRALLRRAIDKSQLLSFDDMHPSIAMLPSQEDAALAFAEVATFMDHYLARHGASALRDGLKAIRDGVDARPALARAAGVSWAKLERAWRAQLRQTSAEADADAPRHLALRLKRGDGPVDETRDVEVKRARRFLRLGDLLWDQDRVQAATVEYEKAFEAASDDPIVGSRLARAALASGDARHAAQILGHLAERYPEHAATHATLGAAQAELGDEKAARQALQEAIRLNPFDPKPHCVLAKLAKSAEQQQIEASACEGLQP